MKNLFKRFTAVISASLIFFFSVVPSSVSALTGSNSSLLYYASDNLFSSAVSVSSNLSSNPTYYSSILVFNYTGASGNSYSRTVDLSLCTFSEFEDYLVFCSYNPGTSSFAHQVESTYHISEYFTSSFDFSPYSSTDSSGNVFLHCIPKNLELDNSFIVYFTVATFAKYNYDISAILSDYHNHISYSWQKTGYFFNPSVNFILIDSTYSYFSSASKPEVSDKLTFTGVRLGVDKKGFLEWLISEGKESVINSTGFNFTQKQLSLLVDVFDSYGNSSFWFYSSLVKTFKFTQHSLTGASALLSTLQELYRDYLDYKNSIEIVEITPDDSAKPHWRQDKTDNTLVTDQEDDTSVVSILREILRTIIYLPSSIRTSFSDLATNIVSIMYNWNRLFDKLDYISPDISGDVDRLIDAINNISVDVPDTSVDVTITDEKQQELDDFFNGWSVDFDNKVKEKFPVTAQLGELFNDDFFEKCGIDCNGDGKVYSYYSENVYAVSEVSTVSELSASSPGSDQKLVSDFIGQFDSADVNFLNDANFSSSVPDWSITVGGKKCEVFSFKLYAKYRTQIHFIISFILWTVYLLSLYKSLPSIIGQVSDVVHGIEKM